MSTNQGYVETLYELALSISPGDCLTATASQALETYLDELDCDTGAIFERVEGADGAASYRRVVRLPADSEDEALGAAMERLPAASTDGEFHSSLPLVETTEAGEYYLMELPSFGVLALCAEPGTVDAELCAALEQVNEKLAATCRHSRASVEPRDRGDTDRQSRPETLDQLYREAMRILPETDSDRVAERAVSAAATLVDGALAGVHRYDRAREALVPVAATSEVSAVLDGGPDAYTDHETVIWQVYRSREPVVIEDTDRFEGKLPGGETPVGSAVVLPLGDHGVFIASAPEPEAFGPTDVEILRLLSTLVEIALDRSKREQGLEGIQEITRAALTAESHEAVAEIAMNRVPSLLDFPLSAIWRYDTTVDALTPLAWTDKSVELFGEIPTFDGEGSLAWRAFQDGETYVIPDADQSEKVYNEDTPIGSEIVVPLGDLGVLVTGSTEPESFAESERQLVEILAANLETALRLIDRRQELDLLDQVLARILRHNIRNDLNIIQGYAAQITDSDDPDAAQLATKIIERCHDLEATAEHAREMRQIVRSREERASVSLEEAVEEAVSMVQLEQPAATITESYETSPTVLAHPDLVTAVRHLLENSIQHHEEGPASAVVEVTVGEEAGQGLLTVTDNGPGIPRSEIEILDQHGESALEHGSGAGLWIIDRVVQYSGATIEYTRDDGGTTVRIEFELTE